MRRLLIPSLIVSLALASCGGGSGRSCVGDTDREVTVSGSVSFDRVPMTASGSLDYDLIRRDPVRGATVNLVAPDESIVAVGKTDAQGNYSLPVSSNTEVRLRVLAEMTEELGPSWQVSVTDNTRANALYSLQGSSICSGNANSERDLHAGSGWTGSSYGEERRAAPFAILDSVYDVLIKLVEVDPDVSLPPIELRWSRRNVAVPGNPFIGEIDTSSFTGGVIFILGDEDNDTDEYDNSVIQHEFTHYLESAIFRSDSTGGPHAPGARIDMRTAFSEGFANAVAAISDGSGAYRDSRGSRQSAGFRVSLENSNAANAGWFNEDSSGLIVYDVFDETNEEGDALSAGFAPIYNAMTSTDFLFGTAQASIYSFIDALRAELPASADPDINALMLGQDINGTGPFGEGETNSGGTFDALPVYHQLSLGDTINLCSSPVGGLYNGIGVRRFVRLFIDQDDQYNLIAINNLNTEGRRPEINLYSGPQGLNNRIIRVARDQADASFRLQLSAGEFLVEFYDAANFSFDSEGLRACYDVRLELAAEA